MDGSWVVAVKRGALRPRVPLLLLTAEWAQGASRGTSLRRQQAGSVTWGGAWGARCRAYISCLPDRPHGSLPFL